jgi:uncharacterized membrane protein (UPF0182 family)
VTSCSNPVGPFRPYYVVSKIPGSNSEHFVLFEPFTPPSRSNMVAYLAAGSDDFSPTAPSSDPGDYGNLTALQFPPSGNILGPAQARNLVNQDPTTSSQISLLSQRGSSVQYGDLLVVPVEDSFLYVQPIYILSNSQSSTTSTNAIPQLKLVDVVNGSQVSLGPDLTTALTSALGQQVGQTCPDGTSPPCTGPPPTGQTAAQLLAQAQALFKAADAALKNGDLATYQKDIEQAEALVVKAAGQLPKGGTTTPSPSPSPSGSP